MKIFQSVPRIDFMKRRKFAFIATALLISISIVGVLAIGINYGIDFRGGTQIQLKFGQVPSVKELRRLFREELNTEVSIIVFGEVENNELLVTLEQESIEESTGELNTKVGTIVRKIYPNFDIGDGIRRVETVGPKVGGELKNKSKWAAFYAFAGILIYIGIRFKFRYGIAAVVAIFHDVIITMGIFILAQKEFTLTIVAAILTIIGYSLNDTIVVFDRVRENVARFPKRSLEEIINLSINESLSRTILTSLTTFLVVFALFLLGGNIIHDFSFAMLIGLVVGTYSSVFVASPVVIALDRVKWSDLQKLKERYWQPEAKTGKAGKEPPKKA